MTREPFRMGASERVHYPPCRCEGCVARRAQESAARRDRGTEHLRRERAGLVRQIDRTEDTLKWYTLKLCELNAGQLVFLVAQNRRRRERLCIVNAKLYQRMKQDELRAAGK